MESPDQEPEGISVEDPQETGPFSTGWVRGYVSQIVISGNNGRRPSNLYIVSQVKPYFDKVVEFAKSRNLLWDRPGQDIRCGFGSYLKYLNEFGETRKILLTGPDGDYGFGVKCFFWKNGVWNPSWDGGLLYYGQGDNGVNGPNFSVRIGSLHEGWSLHT